MELRQEIKCVSRRYRYLLVTVFWLLPLLQGGVWIFIDQLPFHRVHHLPFTIHQGFTPAVRILGFLVSMIQTTVVMYGIKTLIDLFGHYERGRFFKPETVQCFRRLSRVLIGWVVAGLLATPLLALVLTMNNPPGEHAIQFSLESADLTALVVGGILAVIARVMEDGCRLQEEVELTV